MRPGRRRLPRRGRSVPDDDVAVAGLRRVVHDPGQVDAVGRVEQRREHAPDCSHPARRRHRVHDGAAGELVAERDPASGDTSARPRCSAAASAARPPGTTASTSHRSHRRRYDGELFERVPASARRGRATRASTASAIVRRHRRPRHRTASTSATKNGLPDVTANTWSVSRSVCGAEAADRRRGQPGQAQPAHPRRTRRPVRAVAAADGPGQLVVPVGQHQYGRQARRSGGPGTAARRGSPRRPSGRPRRRAPSDAPASPARRAGRRRPGPGRRDSSAWVSAVPTLPIRSRSGPSTRGVARSSQ